MEEMQNKNPWRTRLMLACFASLIVAMLIVAIRFTTAKVLIHHFGMDNAWTRLVFADDPAFAASRRKDAPSQDQDKPIPWAQLYPFDENADQQKSWFVKVRDKQVQIENTVHKKATKRIEEWTADHFAAYPALVELGRKYEMAIGWNIVNHSAQVAVLADGNLTYADPRNTHQEERVASVASLNEQVRSYGGKFFFVQAPMKTNPWGDERVNARFDFANENADILLAGLRAQNVDVLDLREAMSCGTDDSAWHAYFFRTDHHWKPQTAVQAAGIVAEKLSGMGVPVDTSRYTVDAYDWEIRKDFFLGSHGKKVTLARTNAEDFPVAEPKQDIKLHFVVPARDIDSIGGFSQIYDRHAMETRDLYHAHPYEGYGYGNQAMETFVNLSQPETGKKILAITDSFGDPMIPFLSTGVREIIKMDVRSFNGSLHRVIEQEKPDIVFVMYTAGYEKKVDWKSHEDEFDFR